jgi:hypothetical protein
MHLFGCAHNRIDWTSLYAEGATNTGFRINQGYWPWSLDAALGFQLKMGGQLATRCHQDRA